MDSKTFLKVLKLIEKEIITWDLPSVSKVAEKKKRDPFHVLLATILSLRTKDSVTLPAALKLIDKAPTPEALYSLTQKEIQKLIYPVCFYRNKAKSLKSLAEKIIKDYNGKVPDSLEELLSLPGVGRKTANLVLILGFGKKEGLCVDTHVHRVSNRIGIVKTKTPDDTEFRLREVLPKSVWSKVNDILVPYGQKICTPVSPWCSKCKVSKFCKKIGVKKIR